MKCEKAIVFKINTDMPFPIDKKFVIAVSSSALFDMKEPDEVFKSKGPEAYRKYQTEKIDDCLEKGVAFPFVRRFLGLNTVFPDLNPVEVVLLSKNSPECGLRVMRSISRYGLNITRSMFSSGMDNFQYLPAFNATMFLSANPNDTKSAIEAGYAAGTVLNTKVVDDENDKELRLAFDFDGVIADDSAETYYKQEGIDKYMEHEKQLASQPLHQGPIGELLKKISYFQNLERRTVKDVKDAVLKTAIVTARNAPAHERVVTTLKDLGIDVDQVFFLGGIDKKRILETMRPHIFFDDQMVHLEQLTDIPAVHIPFGIANKSS